MAFPGIVAALSFTAADGERTVPLEPESTSLGRSAGNTIVLPEPFASRHHALLLRDGSTYQLVDLSSTHGTYLNSQRIDERAILKSGDVIQLGSLQATKLYFRLQRSRGAIEGKSSRVNDLLSTLTVFLPFEDEPRKPGTRELEQLNFLLSAARALNSGSGIDDILHALLQLTLQLTGVERGFVFLAEAGEMRLAQGLRGDGSAVFEDSTVSRSAMRKAIASESKFSISDTLADASASGWSSILINKIRSIYCIPLRKRGLAGQPDGQPAELLGLLYLDSQAGTGELCAIDHELLDTIAAEAAGLLHNALLAREEHKARQAREELAVAATIHAGLMSIKLPKLPYATLRAKTVPCLAIGGDFYDAIALDDHVCVAVADVSGKGVSAAIVAATLQGILHAQFMAGQSLERIALVVNQFLCARDIGKYATMVMMKIFADGRVEYVNCGHIQPVAIYESEVARLEEGDLVVGLISGATYRTAQYRLRPGERILLATDGVTEAENPAGEAIGEAGLDSLAAIESLDGILARVAAHHAPNHAQDDCTLLEVRYSGRAAGEDITR
jgi:serine phosphatase RsbU (regulator of sigma subunit)/pSer/pThr/pTyr-binding forkhead associated (FHA) protein